MIPKRKLIRFIVRKFWGACAFLLISLAVLVVIGRELSPNLARYKDELSDYLSERLSVDVHIQRMQVDWSGLSPQLSLTGVELVNPQGKTLMSMGNALLKVSLLRSLVNGNLAIDRLEASQVGIELTQNQQGVWQFEGVPWQTTASENINIDDPLDIFLLIKRVDLSNAQFKLNFRDQDRQQLEFPELNFANNGNFHRLNSTIVVDGQREAVDLIVEFRGDPRALNSFSAKGYTRFSQVNIAKVLTALPGNWQDGQDLWNNSTLTLESWFDIFAGGETLFRGRLDVAGNAGNIPSQDIQFEIPKAIGANFTGRLTADGDLNISLRDTDIEWKDFQAPLVDLEFSTALADLEKVNPRMEFRAANIDIDGWLNTLKQCGLFEGLALDALQSLQPQGQLQNVKLLVDTNSLPISFELDANFEQLQIESWRGTPMAKNVNGFMRVDGLQDGKIKGEVKVDSQQEITLQFPTLYENPMRFSAFKGQVDWQVDLREERVLVHSGLLSLMSAEGNARGYFNLFIPINVPPGKEELILQIGMKDALVKYSQKYVPTSLPQDLLNWLDSSLGEQGTVAASGFLYRGGFTHEGRHHAEFQLFADIEQSDLHYHPDWPELKQASGQLWMDRFAVHGDIHSGYLLNGKVKHIEFDFAGDPEATKRILHINGDIDSDANDGIALLNTEVFVPVVRHQLDDWKASGPISTHVELAVPLHGDLQDGQQTVAVNLMGVDLEMPKVNATFKNIKGIVHYTSKDSLFATDLSAEFLGRPVAASMHENKALKQLLVNVQGENTIETIDAWTSFDIPAYVKGETTFAVEVEIASGDTNVTVASDLVGVEVDLPQPFGKTASIARALKLEVPFGRDNTYVRLDYGDMLYGVFHIANNQLRRGVLSTRSQPALPQSNQLYITGQLAEMNFDSWLKTYQNYFSAESGEGSDVFKLPMVFDLKTDQFSFGDFTVENLSLAATVRDGVSSINLASEKIAGDITLNNQFSQPINLDLTYLRLPKPEQKPPSWSDVFYPPSRPGDTLNNVDPSNLPALDFKVADLYLGEQSLGAWSFNAQPIPNGLAVHNLLGSFVEGRVNGIQADQGAYLTWINTSQGTETRIEGRLHSNDLAAVLAKLDQPQILQSQNAMFDFSLKWPGTPTAIETANLNGEVALNMTQGTLYLSREQTATNTWLRLVSILNFDTWVRRLRLDFSDLGRGGLAYDELTGLLRFESGQVYLDEPLHMQTRSGEFTMTGLADLEGNQVDMKLRATLPMGGNLTFLTALAAGLPAAAGVWVVSKIFQEQIDKVSTLSYTLTGPLDDPKAEFERLFDNEPKTLKSTAQ